MPIFDVEIVSASEADFRSVSARALADLLGEALGCEPGRAWVRLRRLDSACYAENQAALSGDELPVFVTVLHARLPAPAALGAQALALTRALAEALGRQPERVHVQYAPAAAGRQAFGGRLVE